MVHLNNREFWSYDIAGTLDKHYSYLVSSKKLEDGFGMDKVAVVNGKGKITRSCDDNMGLDLQFIHNNIARALHDCYGLEMNQTNDFRLLIGVLRDPRAFLADVFTTIHKHSLFMTFSCCTTFRLLAHVSLLRYSISLNVLALGGLWHIFV
ncbi:hypothetical protein CK203_052453 [Vitis vinifera]|uniref:Uncharacterized protein n=1 Tax=Vitis vinifera TaxID=29760 RepID=A0A438HCE7_VITVI|nr:hypothetical protein CK203_052453 [Vitis vinifera]